MVNFTPRPLYTQGKSSRNPLDRSLGGPQSRSRRGGSEEINSQPMPGFEHLIIQPVAQRYTTELRQLLLMPRVKVNKQNIYKVGVYSVDQRIDFHQRSCDFLQLIRSPNIIA
jgi:hypothetical protein